MNSEINLGNKVTIGIDSNIIGAGIGCIINLDTRIFGLTLFCFFLLVKIPIKHGKVYTFKMTDYKLAKVNGKNYFCKPHETFIPETIQIRNRKSGIVYEYTKFALVDNPFYSGVIVSAKKRTDILTFAEESSLDVFYKSDEFYYFKPDQMVKGFIRNDEVIVLSLVK